MIDEVPFLGDYAHHVATAYKGSHWRCAQENIYIPEERVHIIVNGVDEDIYKPDAARVEEFRWKLGVPHNAALVIGVAGWLVKDEGYAWMFESLKLVFTENKSFQREIYVLVGGDGPWGNRYKDLGSNLLVLGHLGQKQLARFTHQQR